MTKLKMLEKEQTEISKLTGKNKTPTKLKATATKLMNQGLLEYTGYPKQKWRPTATALARSFILSGAKGYFEKTTNHTPS